MKAMDTIYVLGSGAIGFPLVAYLAQAGRPVVAVRTSRSDVPRGTVTVSVQNGSERFSISVETASLAQLPTLDGIIVIATKAHANAALARELVAKAATGPLVILQNGIGVEQSLLDAQFPDVYRCILYTTSQGTGQDEFAFRSVSASPIGIITGDEAGQARCVAALSTASFPFRAEANIQREIWKKALINAAFNSICPLLEVDNGVFARDEAAAALAREVVREGVSLTERLGLALSEQEVMEQVLQISTRSDGQLISTLQDLRAGRPTEIAFLNLAIARLAASLEPPLQLLRTELLGKLIVAKSNQQQSAHP